MVYALQYLKTVIHGDKSPRRICLSALFVLLSVCATIGVCLLVKVDYGIMGCFLPVLASLTYAPNEASDKVKAYDTILGRVIIFGVGCVALGLIKGGVHIFSLLAIPLLLLYSGKRGKWNIKYFFYLFYPLHLVVLEGISFLLTV